MPRPKAERPTYALVERGGVYYVQWWQDGVSKRTSCRTKDEAEARRFREVLVAELEQPVAPESPTVGVVLDGYAGARAAAHSKAINWSSRALKRHLEHLPVENLGPRAVERYVAARRQEGCGGAPAQYRQRPRPVADGTLRKELGVLKAALNWALKEDWIPKAPMFDLPPSGEARKRWLTKDEARLLLDAAESLHVRTFIALALFTAGRMSAILDLTWDRVDEQAGVLDLSDGKAHGKKRRQRLPIASFLKPYLAEARAAATTRWVVEYRGGRVRDIGRGVAAAASAAGLEGVTPHVFRHTAATWAIQSGTPVKAVADLLGDTAEMVERHYGHHDPAWMRDVIKGLAL